MIIDKAPKYNLSFVKFDINLPTIVKYFDTKIGEIKRINNRGKYKLSIINYVDDNIIKYIVRYVNLKYDDRISEIVRLIQN